MKKKAGICLVMMCLIALGTIAQNKYSIGNKRIIKIYEQGRNEYASGNYTKAEELLVKAMNKEPQFLEPMLLLGDLYHTKKEWKKEISILQKVLQTDSLFFLPTYLNIANAAFFAHDYDMAIGYLKRYKKVNSDKNAIKRADSMIKQILFVKQIMNNPYDITLKNEGTNLNSDFDEYWPSLTADEQTMVLTVLYPRDMNLYKEKKDALPKSSMFYQEDFYISHVDSSGQWRPRSLLPGKINTNSNEGAQTLSADGNKMFFTGCGRPDSKGSCDIYFSQKTEKGWSEPVNIGAPVNSPYWESQPHFSADGRTLFFISNRPGGLGGKDIWKATLLGFKSDGTPWFGNLENLGKPVNTPKDENSPFLHHDGQTLYFSSNGHRGLGGMDLFVSRKIAAGQWSEPINMGSPINSTKDEIGLIVTAKGSKAYFSTDGKKASTRGKDIYSFNLPRDFQPTPVLYVKGKVFDAETEEVLPAQFNLINLETEEVVVTSEGNSSSGQFLVCLPTGGEYAFKADHPGYLFFSGNFDLKGDHPLDQPYHLDIALQPIKQGALVRLENVFFETDSYNLKSQSTIELQEVVSFLKKNPMVKIRIEGHTDNVGTEKYNLQLSINRAKSVYQYLVNQGIDKTRLEYQGYGYSKPVDTNETEEGRANNRRTEMRIL
ncbi:OmpA family protein [Thermophagus sp. OGC60D27]|uniref:OmpA family protein n=1 Tax=Thermophagus sp. OGC60D27 TaxID=3458415 RepID=UPI0040384123